MERVELKQWAKDKVKGKRWDILLPMIIIGLISGAFSSVSSVSNGEQVTVLAILPAIGGFVEFVLMVGFVVYMTNFLTDKEYKLEQIFSKFGDWIRLLLTYILQIIFVFLWALLLIVPGIIKAIAYSLVPYLLADDKYKDLSSMDILKKSDELMKGHKMDYFVLCLSFIGWHILAAFTLFILEIWILPYQQAAQTKFLLDVKANDK